MKKILKSTLLDTNVKRSILVTVVIPVYNTEKYLRQCLDSVLAQSYQNLEIILIDDGSTDNSGAICDEYSKKDSRIQVIHQENMGQSLARNKGIEIATGDYITFIDSDDKVLPECVHIMLSTAEKFQADIVQTRIKLVSCNDVIVHNNENIKAVFYQPGKNSVNSMEYKVSPCAKLFQTTLVKSNPFPHYDAYEDDASYYRFAYDAQNVCVLDYYTYLYFQTKNSVMRCNDKQKDKKTDYIDVYYDRLNYFIQKNEKELVLGTRNRFCLIIILNYADYKKTGTNAKDLPLLLKTFKEQYAFLKGSGSIGVAREIAYWLFYHFPNLTARLIAILRK